MAQVPVSEPAVLPTREASVLLLTLNRPTRSNALSPDVVAALTEQLAAAAADAGVNVVVLTGSGRTFCAGLDLKHLASLDVGRRTPYLKSALGLFRAVWDLPQPVVAAVNGAAIAGGFDLSAFCDVRLASTEATFGQSEILLGLNPISHPLYHIIGLGRAKELALTGATISADEAHRIGFVNHVHGAADLLPRALEMARRMAENGREALAAAKRLTGEMVDQGLDDALEAAGESILRSMATPEHRHRLDGFLNRRSSAPDAREPRR